MKLMSKNVKDYKMQQLFQYQNKKTAEKKCSTFINTAVKKVTKNLIF